MPEGKSIHISHVADFYAMGLYTFQVARVSGMRAHTGGYECACDALQKAPVGVLIMTWNRGNPHLGQYCTSMPSERR